MNNDKTGGRAFPSTGPVSEYGMSLREHYAGLALQALLSNPTICDSLTGNAFDVVGKAACQAADAMIEALTPTAAQAATKD